MQLNDPNQSERQVYYVNVQSRQIYEQHDIAPYHLEITANTRELEQLRELFNEVEDSDEWSLETMYKQVGENTPDTSEVNSAHDYWIKRVYAALHKLGNDVTKAHIESMNII